MSRQRNLGQPPSSLELLLDAMCNVFGAILFAAILLGGSSVVKKLQSPPESVPKAQYLQSVSRWKVAEDQLRAVDMECEILSALNQDEPESAARISRQAREQYRQQVERANQLAGELEELQIQVNDLRRQTGLMRQYRNDPGALSEKLAAEKQKLQHELKDHSAAAVKLPDSYLVSDQEPWWLLVTAEEIFVVGSNQHVHDLRSFSPGVTINYFKHPQGDYYQLTKIPGRGIKLSEFDFSKIALPEGGDRGYFPGLLCEPGASAHCALLIRELRRSNVPYLWRIVPETGAVLRTAERGEYEVAH